MDKFQINTGGILEIQNLILDHAEKIGYDIDYVHRNYFLGTGKDYYQFNIWDDIKLTQTNYLYRPDLCPEITIVEFFKIQKKIVKLKLNNEYSAVITENGIKVGCQTFSFDKFNELVEAVKRFQTTQ